MSPRSAVRAEMPVEIARRFDALVFDWDGTAVPDREADATRVRELVDSLCSAGMHIVVVSGTHVGNVDGQLRARPHGPGRLLLAVNRGSELFDVGAGGPRRVARREASAAEDAALTRAAEKIVSRLGARGLDARIVSQRLNRRKIDLIPEAEWDDPPKSVIDRLLRAVVERLHKAGFDGIADVVELSAAIAREEGLVDPKITSDAKHVEIGLTDKADAGRAVLRELWEWGIAPPLVCFGGDEFGPLGGLPGSDALMLVPEAAASVAISVGVEPNGVPGNVLHLPGGPPVFVAFLEDQLRRRAEVPAVAEVDGWSIAVDDVAPKHARVHASLLTIADGRIGTTGAMLLADPAATPDVLAAGVFNGDGPLTGLLPAPRWARLGHALGAGDSHRRVLDLHTATLGEQSSGGTRLESVRFVSLARPGVAVLRADVEPPEDSAALVPSAVAHTSGTRNGRAWIATQAAGGSVIAAASQDRDGQRLFRVAAYVTSPGGPAPEGEAVTFPAEEAPKEDAPTDDAPGPEEALSLLAQAEEAGFEALLAEHRRAWALRWERADVQIAGDADLQRATRVGLFHLMGCAGDRGEAAVGARGLTGNAYRGHVFWDADLFVLPFLVATHPPAARAMLEYRVRRLPPAFRRAADEGHEGARFPWESAASGDDVTPHAGRDPSGAIVPIRTGQDEIHIVGDVAWAACFYADWTGDEEFVAGAGAQLLIGTARYWASRIRTDHEGRAHIYGVIGPDEYHEPVDDNAYTNVLARWNLRRAAAAAARYGSWNVDECERARWLALADALVDGYDAATGVYEEFAGFYDLEPILIADIAPRRPITADLLLGRERVRRSQVVKQADVLMLHHLLFDETMPDSLLPNLEFYEPRTAHGSSLSPAIHASVLARAGRLDDALAALRLAAHIDLEDLTATAAGGMHLASMGGVWQAFAFGFMGLRAQGDALAVDPRLPPQWQSLEVRVQFRGAALSLRVEPEVLHVQADRRVAVQLRGRRIECDAGDHTLPLGQPVP